MENASFSPKAIGELEPVASYDELVAGQDVGYVFTGTLTDAPRQTWRHGVVVAIDKAARIAVVRTDADYSEGLSTFEEGHDSLAAWYGPVVEPEVRELALAACWCDELDPRALEGGARCGSCEARDDVRRAEREAAGR